MWVSWSQIDCEKLIPGGMLLIKSENEPHIHMNEGISCRVLTVEEEKTGYENNFLTLRMNHLTSEGATEASSKFW